MAFLLSQILLIWWLQTPPAVLHEPYPAHRPDPTEAIQPTGSAPTGSLPADSPANGESRETSATSPSKEGPQPAGDGPDVESGAESDTESTIESTPDAELSARLQKLLQNALQNPGIQLDSQTDSFDVPQNFLDAVFTPSVFPNERIWIFDEVEFSPTGRLGARASDSTVRILREEPFSESRNQVFFWAKIRLANPKESAILPTPAAGIRIDRIPEGIILYKNEKDMLLYKPGKRAPAEFTLRMAADRHYFREPNLERVPVPAVGTFSGAERLRALSIRFFGRPDAGFLARMARYMRGFDVLKLRPTKSSTSLEEAILMQKRGVCRHRALLFFGIARAWGYDVRLVLNRVHAFVEVRWENQPWVRLDLGGAQLPPNFSPPAAPDMFSRIPYAYRISSILPVHSGGMLHVKLEHMVSPPPFLWALILDAGGHEVQRTGIFPTDSRHESLRIPLLALPGGRYRLILTPPVWSP